MKKRIFATVLALAMVLTMLAGCGGSGKTASTQGAGNAGAEGTEGKTSADNGDAAGEPVKIVMETLYFDAQPADLAKVEAAINEITIPAINVEVELYPLAFMEASQKVSLMISGGQQLDLVVNMMRTDDPSLVNKNMLLPLDDLYAQYGADIKANAVFAVPGGYVGATHFTVFLPLKNMAVLMV